MLSINGGIAISAFKHLPSSPFSMNKAASQFNRSFSWVFAIIAASVVLAMIVDWRAPGLSLSARDALIRARGTLSPPEEIVIVAIDEASIKRFGRFPWPRTVIAQALEIIGAANPKAIALNLLFADPTTESDDAALANAIKQAGNVAVASQLIETPLRGAEWLRPLPVFEQSATGVGHGNVMTDFDGVARALPLREADDQGNAIWSLAAQAIRIGDHLNDEEIRELPGAVRIGSRSIPVGVDSPTMTISNQESGSELQTIRASQMTIDYLGPAGSFAEKTFSMADLIDGRIDAGRLSGKYVLIGATAAAMSDRIASPFARFASPDGNQHGTLMSGVEILANAITTILHSRFYINFPEWLTVLTAALIAAAVVGGLNLAQGRFELARQLGVLIGLMVLILLLSYLVFVRWLISPPLIPAMISLLVAAPLTLIRRVITTSKSLDARIDELREESKLLLPVNDEKDTDLRSRSWLPAGAGTKAKALAHLQKQLIARSQFVDRAMRSVEDGLLIADAKGRIIFANPRAAQILGLSEQALLGSLLVDRLNSGEHIDSTSGDELTGQTLKDSLSRLLSDRVPIEREITIGAIQPHHYILRMASVVDDEAGLPTGLVATLVDITKQRELQQMKNDVMALVTHEMKTPLTAIQGMSEVLMQFEPEAEKRREMNQTINQAARRLKQMIDEYLDLTRLESGAQEMHPAFVRMESLTEQTLLLLDPVASQRGIKITRHFASDLPAIRADATLLSRAITNLVSNAIKYSPANTDVSVSIRKNGGKNGDWLFISIADKGYGIPPEHRTRIFEKFYRVPRIEDADTPGTGLGLALVREIAELHSGKVAIESEVGVGSTFTLILPIATRTISA
ncbi:MAG: CHASE2 domain-containing protein [Blastocatellales bacterium]